MTPAGPNCATTPNGRRGSTPPHMRLYGDADTSYLVSAGMAQLRLRHLDWLKSHPGPGSVQAANNGFEQ